jgi:hypothetical protein
VAYAPPQPDWPWITLYGLPSVTVAGLLSLELERGVYSYEFDANGAAAQECVARLWPRPSRRETIPSSSPVIVEAHHEQKHEAQGQGDSFTLP